MAALASTSTPLALTAPLAASGVVASQANDIRPFARLIEQAPSDARTPQREAKATSDGETDVETGATADNAAEAQDDSEKAEAAPGSETNILAEIEAMAAAAGRLIVMPSTANDGPATVKPDTPASEAKASATVTASGPAPTTTPMTSASPPPTPGIPELIAALKSSFAEQGAASTPQKPVTIELAAGAVSKDGGGTAEVAPITAEALMIIQDGKAVPVVTGKTMALSAEDASATGIIAAATALTSQKAEPAPRAVPTAAEAAALRPALPLAPVPPGPSDVDKASPDHIDASPEASPRAEAAELAASIMPMAVMPAAAASPGDSATLDPGTAAVPSAADQSIDRQLDLARDTQWLDRLAKDISQAASQQGHLKFQLNPEHLGSLLVEIANSASGTTIRMTADSDQARAIIADAQPRLLAEVRAQGLRVAESHVDLNNQQQGSNGQNAQMAQGQMGGGQQRRSSEDHKPFSDSLPNQRDGAGDSAPRDNGELYA